MSHLCCDENEWYKLWWAKKANYASWILILDMNVDYNWLMLNDLCGEYICREILTVCVYKMRCQNFYKQKYLKYMYNFAPLYIKL